MPRLSRTAIAERETFLRDLFTKNPETSGAAAQRALKEKFGRIMRVHRVYEIRDEVLRTNGAAAATAAASATVATV